MPKTLMTVAILAAVGLVAYAVLVKGGAPAAPPLGTVAASSGSQYDEWWQAPLVNLLSPASWTNA